MDWGGGGVNDTYRPTMEDVARVAGVSRTTVSFVLNNRDGARIPPQTRERVQQVAAELGYRPHGGARVAAEGLAVVDEGLVPEGLGVHEGAVHVPQDSAHREVGSGGWCHEK